MRWRAREQAEPFNQSVLPRETFTFPHLQRYHVGVQADAQGALVAHVVGNGAHDDGTCPHTILSPTSKQAKLTALARHHLVCLRRLSPS